MGFDGSLKFDTKLDTSGFIDGLKQIEKATHKTETEVGKAGKEMGKDVGIDTKKPQQALDALGKRAEETGKQIERTLGKAAESSARKLKTELAAAFKNDLPKAVPALAERGIGSKGKNMARYSRYLKDLETAQQDAERFRQAADPSDVTDNAVYERMIELLNEATEARKRYEESLRSSGVDIESFRSKVGLGEDGAQQGIKLNTEPDVEGFEKGTGRMQAAIDALRERLGMFRDDLKRAVTEPFARTSAASGGMEKTIQDYEAAIESIYEKFDSLKSVGSIQEAGKALEDLEYQINQFGATAFNIDGAEMLGSETSAFERMCVRWADAASTAEQSMTSANRRIETEAQMGEQALQRFDETAKGILETDTPQQAQAVLEDLQRQLDTYAAKTYADADRVAVMRETLAALTAEIEKNTQAWAENNQQGPQLSTFESSFSGAVQGYERLATLSGMVVNGVHAVSGAFARLTGAVAGFATSVAQDPAGALDRALGGVASTAAHAATGLARMAASGALGAIKGIAGAAVHAAESLAQLAVHAAKVGASAVVGGIKKLGSAILGVGKSANTMNGGMKMSFMTVLKYGLGIRSLYMLFRKLRTALMEGFSAITQGNSQLQSTVNSFKQSLDNLKLSFASAFAPIVQIVLPYITAMVNALTTAINCVGQFMAALTGKSTYRKATSNLGSVASAANDAGAAAEEAKNQLAGFDKLEILSDNKGGGGSGGGGGGGTGGGASFEDMAIDSGILDWAEKLKEMFANGDYEGIGEVIAQGINAAFEKLDELIKWENVGDTITKYVNAFCRIFNSLVDNIDWELIGTTFGDGINTILHTADLLLTGINWENLGKKFAKGVNGLIKAVDWKLFGKTLGDYFNARINLIHGFITDFDWEGAGDKLADGLNSLVETVDWEKLGEDIGGGMGGILLTITTAITKFDWSKAGKNFGKSVNRFTKTIQKTFKKIKWAKVGKSFASGLNGIISGIDWGTLSKTAGTGINGVFTLLRNAVKNFDWKKLGSSIATSINGLFKTVKFGEIGGTLSDGVIGALTTISTALEDTDWETIAKDMEEFLAGADWSGIASGMARGIGALAGGFGAVLWTWISDGLANIETFFGKEIDDAGGDIVEGILNGVKKGFEGILNWGKTYILDPFLTGFKNAFGIKSPASNPDLLSAAKNIGLGILDGIKSAFANIGKWIEDNILSPITSFLKDPVGAVLSLVISPEADGDWEEWTDDEWARTGGRKEQHFDTAPNADGEEYEASVYEEWEGHVGSGRDFEFDTEPDTSGYAADADRGWRDATEGKEPKELPTIAVVKDKDDQIPAGKKKLDGFSANINNATVEQKKLDIEIEVDASITSQSDNRPHTGSGRSLPEIGVVKKQEDERSDGGRSLNELGVVKKQDDQRSDKGKSLTEIGVVKKQDDQRTENGKKLPTIAKMDSSIDSLTKDQKTFGTTSKYTAADKKALTDNQKTISTTSKYTSSKDGLKSDEKTLDTKSNYTSSHDSLSGSDKTINVTAKIDTVDPPKKTPTIIVTGKLKTVHTEGGGRQVMAAGGALVHGRRYPIPQYASGGYIGAHAAGRFLQGVPKFAAGGSLFIAGEAGPEIVGHIGGRTEVLNKSQLASTMYSAVRDGMGDIAGSLGSAIINKMAECTNAQLIQLDQIAQRVAFTAPAMASGTVLPYAITKTDIKELEKVIATENDELQSVLVQAIAQAANLITAAVKDTDRADRTDNRHLVQQTINEINKRTLMFQASPLR